MYVARTEKRLFGQGIALIALMAADAAQLGFVVSDVAKAIEVCGETPA
jgi:hypothetical protein